MKKFPVKNCPVRAMMEFWGFTLAAEDTEFLYDERVLESWKGYPKSLDGYVTQFKHRRNEEGEIIEKK